MKKDKKKVSKRMIAIIIIAIIGLVIGYNIKDVFLDLLLGGRMF